MRARIAFIISSFFLAACSSAPKETVHEPTDSEREVEALLAEGARLNRAGKFGEAADRFKSAVVIDPRCVRAQYDLGIALDNARDPRGAAESYERAIQLDPGLALAQQHLGEVELALGDRTAARRALEAATALDPHAVQAWKDLAKVEIRDGHPDQAVRRLERAAELEDIPDVWYHLGLARELAGDPKRACEAYEHALKEDPREARSLNNLALLHEAAREVDDAVALWERAIAANPRFVEAEKNLGIALYTRKSQGYVALPHLKAYLDLGGKDERIAGWVVEIREASRTYRTDDRASAVFDRIEKGRVVTADQTFRLRDAKVADKAASFRKGDRIRLLFESATSPNVIDMSPARQ